MIGLGLFEHSEQPTTSNSLVDCLASCSGRYFEISTVLLQHLEHTSAPITIMPVTSAFGSDGRKKTSSQPISSTSAAYASSSSSPRIDLMQWFEFPYNPTSGARVGWNLSSSFWSAFCMVSGSLMKIQKARPKQGFREQEDLLGGTDDFDIDAAVRVASKR